MKRVWRTILTGLSILLSLSAKELPEKVTFNQHLRPVFSSTCYDCHDPDKHEAKAHLQLHTFETATQSRTYTTKSGKKKTKNAVIVPRHPEKSAVWKQISTDDEDDTMPPTDFHHELPARDKVLFKKGIFPVLQEYCIKCHGNKKEKSDINFEKLSLDFTDSRVLEIWHEVLQVVNTGEMPPEDEKQLSSEDLELFAGWLTDKIDREKKRLQKFGGKNVIRRLTDYEYINTMNDLLGISLRDVQLPQEASKEGLKNDASTLILSPSHLQAYLDTAEKYVERAIGPVNKPEEIELSATTHQEDIIFKRINNVKREFHLIIPKLKSGPYRVQVKVAPTEIGQGYRVFMGTAYKRSYNKKLIGTFNASSKEKTLSFYGYADDIEEVPNCEKYAVIVEPVVLDKKRERRKESIEPGHYGILQVDFSGNYFPVWPPKSHKKIFLADTDLENGNFKTAVQIFLNFASKAYRKNVSQKDIQWIIDNYKQDGENSFREKLKTGLISILISPDFLFKVEAPKTGKGKAEVSNHELATRLSYFLWSTMPDKQLLTIASLGKLHDKKVLVREIDRMLESNKIKGFTRNFCEQWLELGLHSGVAVNPTYFPDFDEKLKSDMHQETQLFFDEVFHNNLSALSFIRSNFTFLNERLAGHYGISGVTGSKFQKVDLKTDYRGGLLSQGSFLLATSTGEQSHPIKRGVWVLNKIMNQPPADPPADVELSAEVEGFDKLPLKKQLEVHRDKGACYRCHLKIDPWGVVLEEFDAVGRIRKESVKLVEMTTKNKKRKRYQKVYTKIEPSDKLPDGTQINGVIKLKNYLLENKKEEFAYGFAKKVFTYALGRELDIGELETVKKVSKTFIKGNYQIKTLLKEVVLSEIFLTK